MNARYGRTGLRVSALPRICWDVRLPSARPNKDRAEGTLTVTEILVDRETIGGSELVALWGSEEPRQARAILAGTGR